MTPKEVAAELRISVLTLRRHIGNGAISVIVTGAGAKRPRYVIEADEVERFKEQRRRLQIRRSSTSAEESDTVSWWQQQPIAKLDGPDSDTANWLQQRRTTKYATQGIRRPSRAKKKPPRSP
jgi:predicted site-specific integrase-resolvase